jgi:hypothetical protein
MKFFPFTSSSHSSSASFDIDTPSSLPPPPPRPPTPRPSSPQLIHFDDSDNVNSSITSDNQELGNDELQNISKSIHTIIPSFPTNLPGIDITEIPLQNTDSIPIQNTDITPNQSNNTSQILYNTYDYNPTEIPFQKIISEIYEKKYNYTGPLDELHTVLDTDFFTPEKKTEILKIPEIGISDRNSPFIRDYYNFIDSDPRFGELYYKFIGTHVKKLFPDEEKIIYQTTPNLRISFPGSSAIGKRTIDPDISIIGLHNDGEFGHPPEEINIVIPITAMSGTNSIYFEKDVNSEDALENYNVLELNENQFFQGYLNKLKHYNKVNNTDKTRISLDLRVIPFSKYNVNNASESVSAHKKFKLGSYYSLYDVSQDLMNKKTNNTGCYNCSIM